MIRRAVENDVATLCSIAEQAKLTVTSAGVGERPFFVAELEDEVAGFYSLARSEQR